MSDWFDEAFAGAPLMLILRGMGVDRTTRAAQLAWDRSSPGTWCSGR